MADLPIISNDAQPTVTVDATTNTNVAKVDSLGNQYVANAPLDGFKASYSAAVVGFASATLATDVFTIAGSATKTIRVTRIEMSGTTTAGSGLAINLQLVKRSAANTGGTSTTLTNVPHDSSNAVATATVLNYTANPTALGAAVGTVRSERTTLATTGSGTFLAVWEFGTRPSQAIVLRGTTQLLAVNFNGTTITGPAIDINVEWTEE